MTGATLAELARRVRRLPAFGRLGPRRWPRSATRSRPSSGAWRARTSVGRPPPASRASSPAGAAGPRRGASAGRAGAAARGAGTGTGGRARAPAGPPRARGPEADPAGAGSRQGSWSCRCDDHPPSPLRRVRRRGRTLPARGRRPGRARLPRDHLRAAIRRGPLPPVLPEEEAARVARRRVRRRARRPRTSSVRPPLRGPVGTPRHSAPSGERRRGAAQTAGRARAASIAIDGRTA